MKKSRRILLVVLIIVALIITSAVYYVNDYYKHDEITEQLLKENNVIKSKDYLFIDSNSDKAIIFYPGAKVEFTSYLPLFYELSKKIEVDVFMMKMPLNFAFLGINSADKIIENFDYDSYVLAGHSLGGAMASVYAEKHQDVVSKLIVMGSYVYSDYPVTKSLTIYGSLNDSLEEEIDYKKNVKIIEGGNHANFGNYGNQKGDSESLITREEQQTFTIEYIEDFLLKDLTA